MNPIVLGRRFDLEGMPGWNPWMRYPVCPECGLRHPTFGKLLRCKKCKRFYWTWDWHDKGILCHKCRNENIETLKGKE